MITIKYHGLDSRVKRGIPLSLLVDGTKCRLVSSYPANDASIVIKSPPMSTASARPQLEIRQAQEDDATALCEIFNEAVQDRLETFDSDPRAVDDQRMQIAAARA